MTYDEERDELVFSTGKRIYVFTKTLGLDPDSDSVRYGSDGGFGADELTSAERRELTEAMITRWRKWLIRNP